MAINFDKVKASFDDVSAKLAGMGQFARYWNPKPGDNRIRLAPPWTDEGPFGQQFWREVHMHFKIGPNASTFVCPKLTSGLSVARVCPICDFVEQLKKSGDPADKELATEYAARLRYVTNIIDMTDPVYTKKDVEEFTAANKDRDLPFAVGDTKIRLFSYGPQVYFQLLNQFNVIMTDLTDLDTGYELNINKTGVERKTKYTVMTVPPAKKFTFIKDGKAIQSSAVPALLPQLDSSFSPKSIDEMAAALSGSPAVDAPASLPTAAPPLSLPALYTPPVPTISAATTPVPMPPAVAPQTAAESEEEGQENAPPPCLKDKVTWSGTDAECAGGVKDGEQWDRCPWFQECGEAAGKLTAPPTSRRRGGAKAQAVKSEAVTGVDALEQDMINALK